MAWFDDVKEYVRQLTEGPKALPQAPAPPAAPQASATPTRSRFNQALKSRYQEPLKEALPLGEDTSLGEDIPQYEPPEVSVQVGGLEGFEEAAAGGPDAAEEAPSEPAEPTTQEPQLVSQPLEPRAPRTLPGFGPETRPHDDTAEWAATRQIANAGGLGKAALGMEADLGYYDARLAQEKTTQDDWRKRTAAALKERFEAGQQNQRLDSQEGVQDMNRKSHQDISIANLIAKELAAKTAAEQKKEAAQAKEAAINKRFGTAKAQAERHHQENVGLRKRGLENQDYNNVRASLKDMPQPETLRAMAEVDTLLEKGDVPPGFGRVMGALRSQPYRSWSGALESAIQANLTPEEQEKWNSFYTFGIKAALEDAGKSFTGNEESIQMLMRGMASQDPAVLSHAMRRLSAAIKDNVRRRYAGMNPRARSIAVRDGAIDPVMWGEMPPLDTLEEVGDE